ncbi:hypothetical protein [Actinoplanes couchii]|uniref:hypothetical protein n=1 Tax=Actinoplanes couchii TaxID=403638 RepID=UPI001944ACB9|nr:hypothetical protein [Actinoplanes couchii]MDR6325924.1 hypothetical protein [Actinoplanes couchii]
MIDKAVEVVAWQDESYSMAQQGSINDYNRYGPPGVPTQNPHYQPPASGEPSDVANVQEYVRQALADVPELFTAFAVPDPDIAAGMMNGPLYRTAGTLVPNLRIARRADGGLSTEVLAGDSEVEPVGQLAVNIGLHMEHWEGDAAIEFSGYCSKLGTAAVMQQSAALNLAEIMEAHLEIRRRQLTDAWRIGEDTIKVMDSLSAWCRSRKKSTQTVLTVVGAIAAVVVISVAPEALPAGAALGAEVIQGLGAVLGTVPDSKEETLSIAGATVQDVIQSMSVALYTLQARVDAQEELLVGALSKLATAMNERRGSLLVEPLGKYIGLADADLPELREQFYNR